jgi:hypothetical protein
MENPQGVGKVIEKTREEKLAKFILRSWKNIKDPECPFLRLMEKSFLERVLWLEDQSREQLDNIVRRCGDCGKCDMGVGKELPP